MAVCKSTSILKTNAVMASAVVVEASRHTSFGRSCLKTVWGSIVMHCLAFALVERTRQRKIKSSSFELEPEDFGMVEAGES